MISCSGLLAVPVPPRVVPPAETASNEFNTAFGKYKLNQISREQFAQAWVNFERTGTAAAVSSARKQIDDTFGAGTAENLPKSLLRPGTVPQPRERRPLVR